MTAHALTTESADLPSIRQIARKLALVAIPLAIAAVVATQLPGLKEIPHQLAGADAGWIGVALILELVSTACFALAFHGVYDRRTSPRASTSMSMAVQGMNIVLPSGGAGGLAVGAVLLDRSRCPTFIRRQPDRRPVPDHQPGQFRGRRDRRLRRRGRSRCPVRPRSP